MRSKALLLISLFLLFYSNISVAFDWDNDKEKRNATNEYLSTVTDLSALLDACGEMNLSIKGLNMVNETIEILFKQGIIDKYTTLDLKSLVTDSTDRWTKKYRQENFPDTVCTQAKQNINNYINNRAEANSYLNSESTNTESQIEEDKEHTYKDIVKFINVKLTFTDYGIYKIRITNNYEKTLEDELEFYFTYHDIDGTMMDSEIEYFSLSWDEDIQPGRTIQLTGSSDKQEEHYKFLKKNRVDGSGKDKKVVSLMNSTIRHELVKFRIDRKSFKKF
tara:strand:- start:717 stop:1547 length:831 start_codon:yes stop_codon:yes gene_type:complete